MQHQYGVYATQSDKQRLRVGHYLWQARDMLCRLALIVMLALPAQATALPRVMSLNLCADAYLMAFAEKSQIIALTPQSRDAALSAFHHKATEFPISSGQIEAIAALKPDLVIVSAYSDPLRNRLIKQLGIRVLSLDAADSFEGARQEIIAIGNAIGRDSQARAYLAELDAAMAALRPVTHHPRILPLQRRNVTIGEGHIMDEIIARAGGVNMGRLHGDGLMGRISLERALAVHAEFLLVNEKVDSPDSRGMEFLTHPALKTRYGPSQILSIDNNLLVCAGASTPMAIGALIRQLQK